MEERQRFVLNVTVWVRMLETGFERNSPFIFDSLPVLGALVQFHLFRLLLLWLPPPFLPPLTPRDRFTVTHARTSFCPYDTEPTFNK